MLSLAIIIVVIAAVVIVIVATKEEVVVVVVKVTVPPHSARKKQTKVQKTWHLKQDVPTTRDFQGSKAARVSNCVVLLHCVSTFHTRGGNLTKKEGGKLRDLE